MPLPTFGAVSTIVGVSGSAGGLNGDISANYPSGIVAGQLLVASVYSTDAAGGTSNITDDGSWSAGPQLGASGLSQIAMFYKTASGSESGTSLFSGNWAVGTAAARIVGQIARYSGVDTSGTPYESAGSNNGSSTSVAPGSITTTGANRLAVALIGYAQGSSTIGAISGATGGTWAESAAEQSYLTGTGGRSLSFQEAPLASAGTLSGGSATLSTTAAWRNLTFALIGLPDTLPAEPYVVPSYAVIRSSNY